MNHDLDTAPNSLLTRSNPKIAKGEKLGYLTAVMHFAPHKLAGFNVCASATAGCSMACLNTAGRGGINKPGETTNYIQVARIRRTRFWKNNRIGFNAMLKREVDLHIKNAKRHGMISVIRLNGTSDLPWENLPFYGHKNVFEAYPDIQFYDYTKLPIRRRDLTVPNYNLTFSLAESNDADAIDALAAGLNVAVVMRIGKSSPVPARWKFAGKEYPVIDGDISDVRFGDAGGSIIALRAKGKAKTDTSGFVRDL